MIQACQDVESSTFHANLLAAAVTVRSKKCFNRGKPGHFQKERRQPERTQGGGQQWKGVRIPPPAWNNAAAPSLCPSVRKKITGLIDVDLNFTEMDSPYIKA